MEDYREVEVRKGPEETEDVSDLGRVRGWGPETESKGNECRSTKIQETFVYNSRETNALLLASWKTLAVY